jgi:predicted RecA/RadA family phage recombinase
MQIRNMVSDKSLMAMVESFTHNLPGRQVTVGEKWDVSSTSSPGGMSLDITTNYVLNNIKGNAADITAESNIKASENASPLEYSGARITYGDLKGISKSNLILDVNTGLLLESKAKTHITGNLDVSAQGMELQIPMEINSESVLMALP